MTISLSGICLRTQLALAALGRFLLNAFWVVFVFVVGLFLFVFFTTDVFAATRHHPTHPERAQNNAAYSTVSDDRYPWLGQASASVASAPTRGLARRSHPGSGQAPVRERRVVASRGGMVTVPTAAGIEITVASDFAPKITGFIADLVAQGYTPKKIHCLNFSRSHVPNSLHFKGKACDFEQCGWGCTAKPMYHVAALAAKWGLRDGGEFRDWGHIDMGPHLSNARRIAAIHATPFYGAVSEYQAKQHRKLRYAMRHP